jgi:hypothetical protein
MSARCLIKIVCCLLFVAWTFAATADAQTRREIRRDVQPAPVVPVPVPQTAPVPQPAPPPQQNPTPAPAAVADPGSSVSAERIESRGMERGREGRLLRGRELIGMNIWGPNRQRIGTVKDFIVDYEGDCPTLFFAMAPEISGWSGDYVIVPFDAFQISFDERQRTAYFVLGETVDNLRRAPHLAVDKWNSVHDRQFFTDARQFYHRTERTAARPLSGSGRDGDSRAPREEGMQQPTDRQRETPAPPAQPPASNANPSTGGASGSGGQQPQPAPPASAPSSTPHKSGSTPSKPESAPDK